MHQTWKNDKKPNFGPAVGPFDPNFPPVFLAGFTLTLFHIKLSSYAIYRKTSQPNLRKGLD